MVKKSEEKILIFTLFFFYIFPTLVLNIKKRIYPQNQGLKTVDLWILGLKTPKITELCRKNTKVFHMFFCRKKVINIYQHSPISSPQLSIRKISSYGKVYLC